MNKAAIGASAAALPEPLSLPQVLSALRPEQPVSRLVDTILTGYGDRPALHWRRSIDVDGKSTVSDKFSGMTYADLKAQVEGLQNALATDAIFGVRPGESVCTLGFAGPEYLALNLALLRGGLVSVPLQTAATVEQLSRIAQEVKPRALACSLEALDRMVEMAICLGAPVGILVFDRDTQSAAAEAVWSAAMLRAAEAPNRITLMAYGDAVARGSAIGPAPIYQPAADENPVTIIFYTSGSTGAPKGAIYRSHQIKPWLIRAAPTPQVTVHYQPLSHGMGMAWTFLTLASGGQIYFTAKSDLSMLIDDIAFARPTNLPLVPRVCELIQHRARSEMKARPGITVPQLRSELFGDRLSQALVGSAPISPELKSFIDTLFGFTVDDGYGGTEMGSVAVNGVLQFPPVIDYRLIDVPELGYFTTDHPNPRGELIIKTVALIEGYLGRPDLNASLFDSDGFYHTGDIMEETSPGVIRYLDRRNNVLKLSQGEFVTLAKLEAAYSHARPILDMVYVYGNSSRSYLLAVVVPNKANVPAGLDDNALRGLLVEALRDVAAEKELNSFEIPRNIIVEHEPFSRGNGLLSGIGKYLRLQFKERYQARLEALYAEMALQQEEELDDLRKHGAERDPVEVVVQAARSVLGVDGSLVTPSTTFADLGGDSLSAVSFAILLEDIFGIPIDVGMVMHPTDNLEDLARAIVRLRTDAPARITMESLHGVEPSMIRAADLKLEQVIDAQILANAKGLPRPREGEPEVVLLTGANGFLGRFMCMNWLQRMERNGCGTLICVLRGSDDASAYARLEQAFDAGDPGLAARFRKLAARHLKVWSGDLAHPNLGLSAERWKQLAQTVDVIAHPGALVNHKLHYRQLFQPNVMGTADLIALALTGRMKRFVNVSTVAAAYTDDRDSIIAEDADIREAIPQRRITDDYANGYSVSKWAGEVLLREAHETFDLPVCTFRSNMILAHSQFAGQLNVPDMFTRLVISLVATGIAPASFYRSDPAHAHYEGLPVDFIADAVNSVGECRRSGAHTFHVLSPHDDGVSLDSFVRWIEDEGYPLTRISPYDEWYRRFRIALQALPEKVRGASVLPVLDAYRHPAPVVPGGDLPSGRFADAVRNSACTPDGQVPALSKATIAKYLADLRHLGLIR